VYQGHICIISDSEDDNFYQYLERYNIDYVKILEKITVETIMRERWIKPREVILSRYPTVDRVIMSDTRDMVYQDNPFRFFSDSDLELSAETITIKQCERWNSGWIRQMYGEEVLQQVRDQHILCGGMMAGKREAIIQLCDIMIEEGNKYPIPAPGQPPIFVDQATLNVFHAQGKLPKTRVNYTGDHLVATIGHSLGCMALRDGLVVNLNKTPVVVPAMIHQYDRHPNLVTAINDKYRINEQKAEHMVNVQTYRNFFDYTSLGQEFHFTRLHTRHPVIEYVNEQKNNRSFKVIDVGAGADFWTRDIADATADFYFPDPGSKQHFKLNLERESSWKKVLEYVKKNGKFDFCICSHTLEDLYYPFLAFEMLPMIAKQGMIAVPSLHREMDKGDRGQLSKGYDHHRFVYHPTADNKVCIIQKMGHFEYKQFPIDPSGNQHELQIFWSNQIEFVDIVQMFELFGDSKVEIKVTKSANNISSKYFEIYCRLDPNKPVVYEA
jgi:2-polyprenyl-3-methyl-5-hydroxy-6-metoxy-1,4-benzoquinol methylase